MKEELESKARQTVETLLDQGFEEAAVKLLWVEEDMVKIAETQPSTLQSWRRMKTYIYLAAERRIAVYEFEPLNIDEVLAKARRLRRFTGRISEMDLYAPLPEPTEVKPLNLEPDRRILEALSEPNKLLKLAWTMVDGATGEGAEKTAGVLTLSHTVKSLATSRGFSMSEEATGLECYLRAFKAGGSGQWAYTGRTVREDLLKEVGVKAGFYASLAEKPEPAEPGVYDMLLSPMTVANLVNVVGDMASALQAYLGLSFLSPSDTGRQIGSKKLTIRDEGRNPDLPNSTGFDDEGTPTRTNYIFRQGVFEGFLHNRKTAAKFKTETTGNAGWIKPEPWNLVVEEGRLSEEEAAAELRRGLIVTNNWYTRLQSYVEGVFSTITRDAVLLVKDGRIEKAVKGLRIADTFPRLLSSVEEATRRSYPVKWWEAEKPVSTPFLLVRGLHTSKPTV